MNESKPEFWVVIHPNRSFSGRNVACVLCAYVLVCVGISTGFALDGAWLVAPFMGLEAMIIGAVLMYIAHHACDREIVVIDGDRMEIVQFTGRAEHRVALQRYWARVRLEAQVDGWYPTRLLVGSHGRWVEIGAALTDDGRTSLSKRLHSVLRA